MAVFCFGLACAIGLGGAFVGLETHGFWYDELFTARLLESDGTSLMARIATDVHPPVYLFLLSVHSALVGDGDAALRSFSALCACGAIVVFIAGTTQTFSLAGRLFGAALATGSLFWFFQAQNARSYALGLLISAGIVVLSLRLLREQSRAETRRTLGGLVALMAVGSFVHFYVLYECLGVLVVMALMRPSRRYLLAGIACALVVAAALYVKLVVATFSQVSLGENWYPNNALWYARVLGSCLRIGVGNAGVAAIAFCAAVIVLGRLRAGSAPARTTDPVTLFLVGVPLVVLLGAIASSTLLAPNFHDRNFLVLAPFLGAGTARLYDAAAACAPKVVRTALDAALGVIVLSAASIVIERLPSTRVLGLDYEPIRESAEWITTLPACRSQTLPVITTDRAAWYRPGYAETIYTSGYGRYLHGFARPQLLFFQDVRAHRLPDDLKAEVQRRLDGKGCPVLAWSAHNISVQDIEAVRNAMLQGADRSAAAASVKVRAFKDDSDGFVLYVAGGDHR